jgi:hypothetical protein
VAAPNAPKKSAEKSFPVTPRRGNVFCHCSGIHPGLGCCFINKNFSKLSKNHTAIDFGELNSWERVPEDPNACSMHHNAHTGRSLVSPIYLFMPRETKSAAVTGKKTLISLTFVHMLTNVEVLK